MTPSLLLWVVSSVLVLRQIYSAAPVITSLTEAAAEVMMMLGWSVKVESTIHVANSNSHNSDRENNLIKCIFVSPMVHLPHKTLVTKKLGKVLQMVFMFAWDMIWISYTNSCTITEAILLVNICYFKRQLWFLLKHQHKKHLEVTTLQLRASLSP